MSQSEPAGFMPDALTLGEAMRDSFGICCYPALQTETNGRYAMKTISIPASQVQVEALLLTGVVSNELKALDYYKKQTDALLQEVTLLDKLSKMEGFLPYQGVHVARLDEGVGYRVSLLSPFRQSLQEKMIRSPMTHLEAVNLGLDMCAALTACRRLGHLYVNLKPSNVFFTENRGCCIGDLGFVRLASLGYASYPDKYRSPYTAPEIQDAMSPLNETLDIFALGMMLYQIYHDGQLPYEDVYPDQPLPPPYYADYELAQIILKACAPTPEERWQSPAEFGQALVEYLQRNGFEDGPIRPVPVELDQPEEEPEAFLTDEQNDAEIAQLLAMISSDVEDEGDADDWSPADTDSTEEMLAQADALIDHQLPEPVMAPGPIDVPIPPPIVRSQPPESEDEPTEVPGPESDTPPSAPPVHNEQENYDMTEVKEKKPVPTKLIVRLAAAILLLVAIGTFGLYYYNNVYIQTIERLSITSVEDQIVVRVETKADQEKLMVVCTNAYGITHQTTMTSGIARFDDMKPDTQYRIEITISGNHRLVGETSGTITTCKQTVVTNLTVEDGQEDGSVVLSFGVAGPDAEEWNVEYSANNIAAKVESFRGHSVELKELTLGANYTFRLYPTGNLFLTGETRTTFMPGEPSKVTNLKAVAGVEVGTVTVSFNVEGPDSQRWNLEYTAEGLETQTIGFEGHSVELTGLELGLTYTFRLHPVDKLYLDQEPQLTYKVLGTIVAENLTIPADSYFDRLLHARWDTPEGVGEVTWTVRCQSVNGYDQTIETTGSSCIFSLRGDGAVYVITVIAKGFADSVSVSTQGMTPHPSGNSNTGNPVNPNPGGEGNTPGTNPGEGEDPGKILRVTGFKYAFSVAAWYMELSWDYIGTAPSGWILTYTTNDGSPITVRSETNSTIIYVEANSKYVFEVRPADDVRYDSVSFDYTTREHDYFDKHGFNAADGAFILVVNDSQEPAFAVSSADALYLYCQMEGIDETVQDVLSVTFSVRNAENVVISAETVELAWNEIWKDGVCKLQIPTLPELGGNYAVDLFFDYFFVADAHFAIT